MLLHNLPGKVGTVNSTCVGLDVACCRSQKLLLLDINHRLKTEKRKAGVLSWRALGVKDTFYKQVRAFMDRMW